MQIDAELRQRRRSEHRNQASQHIQQHLHTPIMTEWGLIVKRHH